MRPARKALGALVVGLLSYACYLLHRTKRFRIHNRLPRGKDSISYSVLADGCPPL